MPKRVLIIEDEPNIVESLRFILNHAGYEVDAVSDGAQALTLLKDNPPAVAILDVMLPSLNGFEVLKSIRATPLLAALPVLMLTAKGQSQDRRMAEDIGADAFVTKPFSNQHIVETVDRLAKS